MSGHAIEVLSVTKHYGRVRAVEELTFQVPEGSLFGLIGPNGAGKTTTFGLLSGFLHPTSGEVRIRGVKLTPGRPPLGQVLALPQDASLPERVEVLEVLIMLARFAGCSKAEARARGERALARVGLADLAGRKVGHLSHGQRRRVGIAQTLIGEREVILLDEPTAGLDARSAAELRVLIKSLRDEHTIVLSSHNLQEVEALCDRAVIIDRGRLVASGTMDEIKSTSTLVFVALAKALGADERARIVGALGALQGVRSAVARDDGSGIDLQLENEGDDQITNQVLRVLIEQGASVKGVERGKSLEQKFLESTSPRA